MSLAFFGKAPNEEHGILEEAVQWLSRGHCEGGPTGFSKKIKNLTHMLRDTLVCIVLTHLGRHPDRYAAPPGAPS